MGSARQRTQAKAARERSVRERRDRKREKKRVAAAERKQATGPSASQPPEGGTAGRA